MKAKSVEEVGQNVHVVDADPLSGRGIGPASGDSGYGPFRPFKNKNEPQVIIR